MLYFSGMYQTLKKVALSLVPKKILFEHEIFFRSIFAFHFGGKNHECTVCAKGIKKFIKIPDDLLCPFCGSRSRTRRLYSFLNSKDLLHGKVLHFSPSRSVFRLLKKNPKIYYFSTDYEDEFIAEYHYDITQIPLEKDFFDLIICYHILEHIEDDKKAMSELYRVLKKNGTCIIQTPFKTGAIYEDFSKKTPKERLKAFGQEDHVRVYSVDGLLERLDENGFKKIEAKTFPPNERYGFMEETVLIGKK
ncbi:methyltransferase domain-containing protein [Aequorivita sp. F47161]|uniref:Methyltransferase domain-containing protein n=1 Tax=Aequorivita vitellina TaxID=2874475 RepID=A0A9X1QYB0_9FLAO|nr:class I SAM-dependent methyltransferase [Aequorivita vitellina]MCG2419607.1 methyltransferase domain-containing protein [Aequorivita vitellina]